MVSAIRRMGVAGDALAEYFMDPIDIQDASTEPAKVSMDCVHPSYFWIVIFVALGTVSGVGCDRSKPLSGTDSVPGVIGGRSESPRSERPLPNAATFDPSTEVFSFRGVHALKLGISESNIDKLQRDERPYVRASMEESGRAIFSTIGVKLKGAAGSFQGFDGKPGFTLNMDKYEKGVRFHSLDKFHLNNSVQDDTYLNEWLGSEVFRRAHYPAPRVAHAVLTINERPPELYVLREGYDEILIQRFFTAAKGNLYDGGFVQDLDAELEKDAGDGVDDHSDLRAIATRLGSGDFQARVEGLSELIDLDRFLTFFALERMVAHWDGYCNSANNYRLYLDPDSNRAVFLPHGMDQIFGDIGMPLFDPNGALVARVVMSSDTLRSQYREKVRELMPIFYPPDELLEAIEEKSVQLQESMGELGEAFQDQHRQKVEDLKQRIRERAENMLAQLEEADPVPIEIPLKGSVPLDSWYPSTDGDRIAATVSGEGATDECFKVNFLGEQSGMGAWRCPMLLSRGKYFLRGRFRVSELQPLDAENLETIVYGTQRDERWLRWEGDAMWQEIAMEITVLEDRASVEVLVGVRGAAGNLVIDRKSMRLERLE